MYAPGEPHKPKNRVFAAAGDSMTLAENNVRMHESMSKAKRLEEAREKSEPNPLVAKTITIAIDKHWEDSITALAVKAGVHETGIHGLKSKGVSKKTTTLKKVCRALKVDPDAILAGEIRLVPVTDEPDDDIVELAIRLKGTKYEESIRNLMRTLAKEIP